MRSSGSWLQTLALASVWIVLAAGVAHAHGGMAGPDELGPPVGLSVAIGLACYFGITLWPSNHRSGERRKRESRNNRSTAR